MELEFEVFGKIRKPVAEVFDAVYNPRKLEGYFTTGSASAPLDEGTTVMWDFADFPGAFPVHVKTVVPNERIVLEWSGGEEHGDTRVDMRFESLGPNETLVKIAESGWKDTPDGLKRSYGNCMGWSQMSACMKAYLEYGINLREGFY